jgi:hypothetical protein
MSDWSDIIDEIRDLQRQTDKLTPTDKKILTLLARIVTRQEEMRLGLPLPPVGPSVEDRLQMQRLLAKADNIVLDLRAGFRDMNRRLDAIEHHLQDPPRGFDG